MEWGVILLFFSLFLFLFLGNKKKSQVKKIQKSKTLF